MTEHILKVQPPYFDALLDGSKMFEVRRNDRAFQRGDVLILREFGRHDDGLPCETKCNGRSIGCPACHERPIVPHYSGREIGREVTFVYAGDPRFGGIEPGHVVLGLAASTQPVQHTEGD